MKYMGSKSKIATEVVKVLQDIIYENKITDYYEPFCGGCNILDKIICKNIYASDIHKYLIALLQNLDKLDSLPDNIEFSQYSKVRHSFNTNSDEFEDWYKGAIGFLSSYNGRFFDGGYSGTRVIKVGNKEVERNYFLESKNNLLAQRRDLVGVNFKCCNYNDLEIKAGSLVYCDPPYAGTKGYSITDFNTDEFWEWVREISKTSIVIVSEETATEDFEAIWEKSVKRTINTANKFNKTEKLFRLK